MFNKWYQLQHDVKIIIAEFEREVTSYNKIEYNAFTKGKIIPEAYSL